jgi:REP element-mobilizing transposase RayT
MIATAETQLVLDLAPRKRGGKRKGAGRKRKNMSDPPHRSRPKHVGRYPLHVVLRATKDVPRLRQKSGYAAVSDGLETVKGLENFRVAHISVQRNHIHMLVEADDSDALDHGMRALTISLARQINKAFDRRGKVFACRYHVTVLRSPTQVRHALVYVLNNWRRHDEDERGLRERHAALDPYSSAVSFEGWQDFRLGALPEKYKPLPVRTPRTWLLAVGWEKAGKPMRTRDVPGPLR